MKIQLIHNRDNEIVEFDSTKVSNFKLTKQSVSFNVTDSKQEFFFTVFSKVRINNAEYDMTVDTDYDAVKSIADTERQAVLDFVKAETEAKLSAIEDMKTKDSSGEAIA